ncbi:MAG: TylF/MycF/NovP-related O-methyltransferase [Sphaerospermopsis kisseleviana]
MPNSHISTVSTINYNPSLVAKIAKLIIPILAKILPASVYKLVYDFLYRTYQVLLRYLYGVKAFAARIYGDKSLRMKTSLTWKLLPYTMGGSKALENAFEVTALAELRNLPGAIVECGVAQGGTSAMMALTNRLLSQQTRQKWLFDSYEGLPEPTAEDYEGGKAGNFIRPLPKGSCLGTIEQVSELMFDKLGFPQAETHLVKGWFQDTVPAYRQQVGEIAVLRLDGDWYESTKVPLENFYDLVVTGGLIIVDDYATCFGSRKAVDEFRSVHNITNPLKADGRGGVWFEK